MQILHGRMLRLHLPLSRDRWLVLHALNLLHELILHLVHVLGVSSALLEILELALIVAYRGAHLLGLRCLGGLAQLYLTGVELVRPLFILSLRVRELILLLSCITLGLWRQVLVLGLLRWGAHKVLTRCGHI